MGDNEEHLGSILFLDNYVQEEGEACVKGNLLMKHRKRF